MIVTAGIGSDHTDLQGAMDRVIAVAEVTHCNSNSVAEHMINAQSLKHFKRGAYLIKSARCNTTQQKKGKPWLPPFSLVLKSPALHVFGADGHGLNSRGLFLNGQGVPHVHLGEEAQAGNHVQAQGERNNNRNEGPAATVVVFAGEVSRVLCIALRRAGRKTFEPLEQVNHDEPQHGNSLNVVETVSRRGL